MTIALVGTGNVATNMALALQHAGIGVNQIWSRRYANARELAHRVNALAVKTLKEINADICIVSVKDDAIAEVLGNLVGYSGTIVHTSGAVHIDVFKGKFANYGVFYPLQTFSKDKMVDFANLPLCLEAGNRAVAQQLQNMAKQLSSRVSFVDSAQRKILHLAAVFACNFPNYLYGIADSLLQKHQLDFDLLRPLILETALKAQNSHPANVQTGPAIRGDESTMHSHLELIGNQENLKAIYQLLSESIKSGK